ncbi:uncharacterized protein SPAPADRAFT_60611 [Spathaspora passalidarum NRRL Y-27907]|uniref:Mitochondrial outer membrane transport complex Sam37/metaxin N-terminal domain-containing protein n=1 Tax=Spathaspora passalidarum (strain NRRL Y-27907 / 11-Y1) TaxID=619300 RepID=G3ALN3_SPAPN|nr:uncharacterized protein SPAPADRAFT_60611 [Spathaspora passalidarum NRRL Y-27907]EGW33276.1 hypothetical protein SPAPADRAFT_60611 [Spathaspora passalidarum NRRL Y-27907]
MLQLHVWGVDGEISLISPECLASAWLLSLVFPKNDFEIVTSSNTNISDINKLPVLITDDKKLNGFSEIVDFIDGNKFANESGYWSSRASSPREKLIHSCLLNLVETRVDVINQYNLYSNTKNYEKYTRKLFQNYFPFPMMYNQPLKFHNNAVAQVKLLGLSKNKTSFFDFTTTFQEEVAETEYFNSELSDDEDEEEKEVALSSLHEKQLIAKSKTKAALLESKNSLRCLVLLNHYLQEFIKTFKLLQNENENAFGYLFGGSPSACELLLYAYLHSLSSEKLPDRFVSSYLDLKHEKLVSFSKEQINNLQKSLSNSSFRPPQGAEIPSLFNEVGYLLGSIKY